MMKASHSDKRSSFKQWVLVPLFSFLLYRYVYLGRSSNKFQTEPSTPTFAVLKNTFGGNPWKSFPGSFRLTPAFPDHASRYDVFSFRPDTGDFDVIEIKGQFPFARYFGINLYDFDEATDFAALADREMIPHTGSRNPYAIGNYNKNSIPLTERYYTIWLVSESVAMRLQNEQQQQQQRALAMMDHVNIMTYPDGIPTLAIMNRVYRPNRGQDSLGGVPLPRVEAFKLDGSQAKAPQPGKIMDAIKTKVPMFLFNKDIIKTWELMKEFSPDNEVVFRRVTEAGLFPNRHIKYIVAALDQFYWNKVAVVTVKKTPTVDDTYNGGDFQKKVNVRYWSFCVGDNSITGTPSCIVDDEARHNPGDSSVTIVVAPFYLKSKIEQAGLNYLAWGLSYKPLLIHRHMLADDKQDGEDNDNDFTDHVIGNIPTIGRPPAKEDWNADYFERHSAQNFMGEYTPHGKIFGVSEFVERLNHGDFRVAFDYR